MLILWFIICIMIILALSFLIAPLVINKKNTLLSQPEANRQIYKERLQALDDQLQQQTLTSKQYQIEKQELLQQAANDIPINEQRNQFHVSNSNYKLITATIIFFILVLPTSAIILYLNWGDSAQLARYYAQQQNAKLIQQELAQYKNPQQLIDKMQSILQQHPNSARGWYLLGRLYMNQDQFTLAANAFAKANKLKPSDPLIMQQYAESLFFANKNVLTHKAKQLLLTVLQKIHNDPDAINLLAINAYNQKDYQSAINYWEQLANDFDPASTDGKVLLQAIADAQKALAEQGKTKQQINVNLPVRVTIANNLQNKILTNEILFIYAKAINGPPMPLAIYRTFANQLPITINLTDKMSMLPNITLANFSNIRVYARISKTGSALPKLGDLQGVSEQIRLQKHNSQVNVVINTIVGG